MRINWIIGLVVLLISGSVRAQVTERKIIPSEEGEYRERFGYSVSLSDNRIVVGVPYDWLGNDDGVGSACIFERDPEGTWLQSVTLRASDSAYRDYFGASVSISGSYAIMGARGNNDDGSDSGSAYVFQRNPGGQWSQASKLTASDAASGDKFGVSVSVSGDLAIVGAGLDDDNASNSGSVYAFKRNESGAWIQDAKLLASDPTANDYFGSSVCISDDSFIAGARGHSDNGERSGSAYIFDRAVDGTWSQTSELLALDGQASDLFGFSVSISGDYAIVGARDDSDNGYASGSAYIFERSAEGIWSHATKLRASDAEENDNFGQSVSISGDYALVGAYGNDDDGENSGSAYLFGRSASGIWSEKAKLTASDATTWHGLGWSVSIDGSTGLAGSPYENVTGLDTGSAYIFENLPEPATLSMLVVGGLVMMRRRRRK